MKRVLKGIFVFLICYVLILEVKAEGTISLTLSCPNNVKPGEKIICDIYARVRDNKIKSLQLEAGTKSGPVENIKINYETEVSIGENVNIGTITADTTSQSGEAVLYVKVTKAVFEDDSESTNATDNAYISVEKSNVNTLNSIKLDGETISGFSKSKTSYSITTTKDKVTITAVKTSEESEISGTGTKQLTCGANVNTINVKAENGEMKNYTLNITRKCEAKENEEKEETKHQDPASVNLKDIIISKGKLSPEFKENITEYKVEVDKETEEITITGIKSETEQKITGNVTNKKLEYGENKINITVSNDNGEKKIYTVIVIREDNRDDNNYLSSISLSSGVILFDKNTFEYETKVLNNVEKIEIIAVPEKQTSKVEIEKENNLQVGENIITIKVISEKETERIYTIKVTRLKEGETLGNNPYIKNIIIKNYDLKFDYNKENYKLVIKDEDSLDIEVLMEDETATYQIIGNENLKDGSIIKIKTSSLDGTTREYTIEVTKTNYLIYYIIFAILVTAAITIPIFVYFKSVKKKKENLDVNGYKIGKEYEEKDYSRKVILGNNNQEKNINEKLQNNQYETFKNIPNNQINENNINQNNIIGEISNNDINNKNLNKETSNENDFDRDLNNYIPNIETKCPNCGRELLGHPDVCPYCKNNLKQ